MLNKNFEERGSINVLKGAWRSLGITEKIQWFPTVWEKIHVSSDDVSGKTRVPSMLKKLEKAKNGEVTKTTL